MKQKVSIIIPTKNRFNFIKRQLEYYHSVKSCHPIYIGDSSEGSAKDKLKKIIDNFKNHLDINYFYFPKDSGPTVKMKLADKVTEKYCTYAGDDDFFVPNSSLGPTIISFFSGSIFITYKASLSETLIPLRCPIVKLIIPS